MTTLDTLSSFELGLDYGFLKATNPDQCPPLDATTMGADPKAFAREMEAGYLAGFKKRHHL